MKEVQISTEKLETSCREGSLGGTRGAEIYSAPHSELVRSYFRSVLRTVRVLHLARVFGERSVFFFAADKWPQPVPIPPISFLLCGGSNIEVGFIAFLVLVLHPFATKP